MKAVTFLLIAAGLCACGPNEAPLETSALSESCCGEIGLCVPKGFVPSELSERLSSECEQAFECVPLEWVVGVSSVPESCRTSGELEGRCLPSCMPELVERAPRLSQQSCDSGYLCVPCFDPLTGEDTEACHLPPDPGPAEPAPVLTACGGGAGRCAARKALESFSVADVQQLRPDEACAEPDMLCVPDAWLATDTPEPAAGCDAE